MKQFALSKLLADALQCHSEVQLVQKVLLYNYLCIEVGGALLELSCIQILIFRPQQPCHYILIWTHMTLNIISIPRPTIAMQ